MFVYEVTLDKTKWLIYAIYRLPSMANNIFANHMNILLDKGFKFIENDMVIGDHESSYAPSVVRASIR
jgi:hypothetical protein